MVWHTNMNNISNQSLLNNKITQNPIFGMLHHICKFQNAVLLVGWLTKKM